MQTPAGMSEADFAAQLKAAEPTRATSSDGLTGEVIDDMFEYHAWSPEQQLAGGKVRAALANAVKVIVDNVPPGPDRSVAIRKLREARMDANSAITHGGRY